MERDSGMAQSGGLSRHRGLEASLTGFVSAS